MRECVKKDLRAAREIMEREHRADPTKPCTKERLLEILYASDPTNNRDSRELTRLSDRGKRTSFTDQLFTDRDDDPTDKF